MEFFVELFAEFFLKFFVERAPVILISYVPNGHLGTPRICVFKVWKELNVPLDVQYD